MNELEQQILDLVVTHTKEGKTFNMNYKEIAEILQAPLNKVKYRISTLKKNKYIDTKTKRYGIRMGSRTTITVL